MADMNRWHRTLERRMLRRLRSEVEVLRAATDGRARDDRAQRRAFTRVIELFDAKIEKLDEEDERGDSWSADDIAPELKA